MLSSIHPLGERGRNSNYLVTVVAYIVGSVVGGVVIGGLSGGIGQIALGGAELDAGAMLGIVGVVALVGVAMDLRVGPLGVPSYHRQVNEEWLNRYRGWVYGAGFGLQLGFGFVTIVPSAGIYATFLLTALTGSFGAGVVIGATFGLVRSVMILLMAGVETPDGLRSAHRRLARIGAWAHRTVVATQGAIGLIVVGVLLWQ